MKISETCLVWPILIIVHKLLHKIKIQRPNRNKCSDINRFIKTTISIYFDHVVVLKHIVYFMQAKNFSMNILKQSSSIWVPELISNLDTFLDQIEATLSNSSSASYFSPLQQFLFTFLSKVLARADPSLDPKIAESGSSMLNKWLAVQLLPTVSVGTIQPLEEIFLHSFSYPYALVSGDYNKLYNFIKQHGNTLFI